MTTPSKFFRLCVDLDIAGNPIGSSLEVHDGRTVTTILVLAQPGPFDTSVGAFRMVEDECFYRFGRQDRLFHELDD